MGEVPHRVPTIALISLIILISSAHYHDLFYRDDCVLWLNLIS